MLDDEVSTISLFDEIISMFAGRDDLFDGNKNNKDSLNGSENGMSNSLFDQIFLSNNNSLSMNNEVVTESFEKSTIFEMVVSNVMNKMSNLSETANPNFVLASTEATTASLLNSDGILANNGSILQSNETFFDALFNSNQKKSQSNEVHIVRAINLLENFNLDGQQFFSNSENDSSNSFSRTGRSRVFNISIEKKDENGEFIG